jgi:hypothetical protein
MQVQKKPYEITARKMMSTFTPLCRQIKSISDALLGAIVAHEGGHDECSNSSGFSRKRKKRENEKTFLPCEPGKTNFLLLIVSLFDLD